MRALSGLLLAALAVAACHRDEPKHAARPAAPVDPAAKDATVLGGEIFELVDRAADFRSAHRGRYPASVAKMGVDSLTPTTARRISSADPFTIVVAFRRPAGHIFTSCSAGADALENASLNSGRFTVVCTRPEGGIDSLEVSGTTR